MLKVATQGQETKEVPYTEGMRVSDALQAAGIEASKKATITVGGKDAKLKTSVKDQDLVIITPKISNG